MSGILGGEGLRGFWRAVARSLLGTWAPWSHMGHCLRCYKRTSLEGLKEEWFCVSRTFASAVHAAADSGPRHLVRDVKVKDTLDLGGLWVQ